ncbi:MAG: rhodanese-related sulfurtransferase [bacterium]
MYKILLYYKYTHIADPKALRDEQRALCERLGMKGRIIVATEGINGTIEGTEASCLDYMRLMKSEPQFADIHWKVSTGTSDGTAFPRLSVKARKEIVSLHLADDDTDIDPNQITGVHLKPEDLKKWYEEGKEFYIVDMRNDYELTVGKFEGTIFPELNNFRDLKKNLAKIEDLKGKTVLSVCTGGVRCEKASGLLVREGFKDVYQLDGGIVSYMEKFPGQNFKGSLYVFDKRVVMNFDKPENHEVISKCSKCGKPSEHYVNCANLMCHRHFICCPECLLQSPIEHPPYGVAYCNLKCKISWAWYQTTKKIKKVLA